MPKPRQSVYFRIVIDRPNSTPAVRHARGVPAAMEILDEGLRNVRGTRVEAVPISQARYVRETRPVE